MKKKFFLVFAVFCFFYPLCPKDIVFGSPVSNGSYYFQGKKGSFFGTDGFTSDVAKIRKGVFLVADPDLRDPNFVESVVLITEHGPEGTVGVIVNRETDTPLSRVFPEMEGIQVRDDLLFIGGPVYPQGILLLVRTPEPLEGTTLIFRDVYYSSSLMTLGRILDMPDSDVGFRIFSGHAGWGSGQLEGELALGAWEIVTARPEEIFDSDPNLLWKVLRNRTDQQYIQLPENLRYFTGGGN